MHLGLAVLQKHLTGDYREIFGQDGFVLCVLRGPECLHGVNLKVKEKNKKTTTYITSCITSYHFLVITTYLLIIIYS